MAAKEIAAPPANGLGLSRFDVKYSIGTLSHEQPMCSIELYGARILPLVRDPLS